MKRKLPVIIVFVLALSFTFAACTNSSYTQKAVKGTQDTSYAILGNGGSVVQYGNYVYFINGYRGFDDAEGTSNVLGKVEKGALYRAELIPGKGKTVKNYDFYYETAVPLNVFDSGIDTASDSGMEFYTREPREVVDTYQLDDYGNVILVGDDEEKIPDITHFEYDAVVDRIAPKTIGTSGYSDGGIFIFDDYIFYASPNNNLNRNNQVQYNKTDFYRTKIDGSKTERVYTSKTDTASSPYMFYKWQGSYYLALLDGTEIISVKMDKKIRKPQVIAEDVTSAYFASKDIYYNFKDANGVQHSVCENGVEDFIYFVREATDEDPVNSGSVLEMMRPSGEEGISICNNGGTVTVLDCNDGLLFYKSVSEATNRPVVHYTNLASMLAAHSPTYRAAYGITLDKNNNITADSRPFGNVAGSFSIKDLDGYTKVKCLRPDYRNASSVYVVGFKSEGVDVYTPANASSANRIYSGDATYVKIIGNDVYFANSGNLMRVNLYTGGDAETIVTGALSGHTFMYGFIDEYVMYFGTVEENYATQYPFFKKLYDLSGEGKFVGYRTEDDYPPEEE